MKNQVKKEILVQLLVQISVVSNLNLIPFSQVPSPLPEPGLFFEYRVCLSKKHNEFIISKAINSDDYSIALLQIDNQPERFVAGFFDNIDATTSVFVGLDRRDEPVAPTSDFLKQMAVRNGLYLRDTDRVEAIEHWSMAASRKAIKQIKSKSA